MDISLDVTVPAPDPSLVTLMDCKTALGIAQSDGSKDDQLRLMIRWASAEIAAYCNRVFAQETLTETFTNIDTAANRRLYLSHYPVVAANISSVAQDGTAVTNYRLDAGSGTLLHLGSGWSGTVVVTYTGGYRLPQESPEALQQAAMLMTREQYYAALRGDSTVRMISHKETRIMYYDPNSRNSQGGGGGGLSGVGSPTRRVINDLLRHFMQFWV